MKIRTLLTVSVMGILMSIGAATMQAEAALSAKETLEYTKLPDKDPLWPRAFGQQMAIWKGGHY